MPAWFVCLRGAAGTILPRPHCPCAAPPESAGSEDDGGARSGWRRAGRERSRRMQMASTAAPKMIHGASTIRSLPVIRAALVADAVSTSACGGDDRLVEVPW